jgi:hypothetical protein
MATTMLTTESPQAVHRRATPCVLLLVILDVDRTAMATPSKAEAMGLICHLG